jgi:hypothetical protein
MAEELNVYLRDNLLELAPHKAETPGSYFATVEPGKLAERVPAEDFVATSQQTTSTTYTDLGTVGPSVTVETSSSAMVFLYAQMFNSASTPAYMNYDVTGATDSLGSANENRSLLIQRSVVQCLGAITLHTDLSSGLNTFTAKYRIAGSGTASFSNRRIVVLPF